MARILFLAFLFAFLKSSNSEEYKPQTFECGAPPSFTLQSGIIDPSKRWPNGVVSYTFDPFFSYYAKMVFLKATVHIMGRTCIRFKRWTSTSNISDYIYVTKEGSKCSSKVGKAGGQQNVTLPPNCTTVKDYLHQLVHTIGFYHEQSRTDRDQFVAINWENILPDETHRFEEKNASISSTFGVPYDYKSVMHFARDDASKDGKDTITPLDPDVTIGMAYELSDFDIKEINNMNCPGTQGMRFQNEADGMYLTVEDVMALQRPVTTANWTGRNYQKWTVDWFALKNRTKGSSLMTWLVDMYTLDVMSANLTTGEVGVWTYNDAPELNQMWYADKNTQFANYLTWQFINLNNTKCLLSMGTSQAMMATCNASDPKQLWKIYNV